MTVSEAGRSGGELLSILVIEDEFWVRAGIAEHLRQFGHRMIEAATAEEAVQINSSIGLAIDVVFCDIRLAGPRSGLDLARWIAANHSEIPVILTSGVVSSADVASDLIDQVPLLTSHTTLRTCSI